MRELRVPMCPCCPLQDAHRQVAYDDSNQYSSQHQDSKENPSIPCRLSPELSPCRCPRLSLSPGWYLSSPRSGCTAGRSVAPSPAPAHTAPAANSQKPGLGTQRGHEHGQGTPGGWLVQDRVEDRGSFSHRSVPPVRLEVMGHARAHHQDVGSGLGLVTQPGVPAPSLVVPAPSLAVPTCPPA